MLYLKQKNKAEKIKQKIRTNALKNFRIFFETLFETWDFFIEMWNFFIRNMIFFLKTYPEIRVTDFPGNSQEIKTHMLHPRLLESRHDFKTGSGLKTV
jgi:hypothetical protein